MAQSVGKVREEGATLKRWNVEVMLARRVNLEAPESHVMRAFANG
jgi:hypothetical protein